MLKILKINIAVLVCTVFVFRLFFVNIGIISSFNTGQNSLTSSIEKKHSGKDAVVNGYTKEFQLIEICEEENENDEDDLSKTKPFFLISYVYSDLSNKFNDLKSTDLFDFLNYKLSSKKYLAISVLRI